MSFLPLSLGVKLSLEAGGAASLSRIPTKDQAEKALRRDGFACRCCGFTSKKFQRVIFHEAAPESEGPVTVCTFCEMCFAIDRTGLTGAGLLIWLPELSQAELNHVARALHVAQASDGPLAKPSARTLEVLMARRLDAKKRLGTDDPLLLATALLEELDEKAYAARVAKMEGIRLLPLNRYFIRQGREDVNIFPQMLNYWTSSSGPFARTPVAEWEKLFEQVTAKAAE